MPQARKGCQTARRYQERTPVMAARLSDNVWSVEGLLLYPAGE